MESVFNANAFFIKGIESDILIIIFLKTLSIQKKEGIVQILSKRGFCNQLLIRHISLNFLYVCSILK
jgi:hypothetical protein